MTSAMIAAGQLSTRYGDTQAAQPASFVFFPLPFLAPTLLPEDQLQRWLGVNADVHPAT